MRINIFLNLIISILIISNIGEAVSLSNFDEKQIDFNNRFLEIQNEIINKEVDWVANYSSFKNSLHFVANYEFDIEKEFTDDINYLNNLPDKFDWRNVSNTNWITQVKNQGSCGSCTAFGTLGALEAVVQIELGKTIDIDLSEADLYYCNGGDCNRGITISDAAQYVSSIGVSDELCFPYVTNSGDCEDKSFNWENRVIKAKKGTNNGVTGIKNAIYQYGPVVSAFNVYEDFYYYLGGIYEHVYGIVKGGHAITIVGWDDDPGYWICKNSWGRDWGEYNPYSNNDENGYFRIKYDECGIGRDTHFFYDFSGNIPPSIPKNLKPYHGQNNVNININLSWNNSFDYNNDEISYNIYFSEGLNVGFDDILIEGLTKNYYNMYNLNKNSNYSWFVVTEDEHGSQSMSNKILFSTRSPLEPIVNGPSYIRVNKNITFTAYPSEICKGNEYYWEFDWGDGSNTILGPYSECIEIKVSHIWTNKGVYSIGTRYREDDIWSDWGNLNISIYKFKIFNNIQNRNFFIFNRLLILQ